MAARNPVRLDGPPWLALIDALREGLEPVLDRILQRLLELPSYAGSDVRQLRDGLRNNCLIILASARELRDPEEASPDIRETFVRIGEVRARQGISASDLAQGWRIGITELQQRAREELEGVSGWELLLLQFFERTVPWTDFGMAASAEGHREVSLEIARQEQHARANFVRAVLFGELGAELRATAEVFGLDTSSTYHAVRARPGGAVEPRHIEGFLQTLDTGQRRTGLVALVDGDLCGFVQVLPAGDPPAAIGVSGAVRLDAVGGAFRQATRALETALNLGLCQTCDLAALGLHPAIAADRDVGDALIRRYVEPLEALGASGRMMLETVELYIANDRRLQATAEELHVHVNTLRYRVARFEELTDCSLRNHVALFEVWWALQRRALG